jgi:hypothetical protein
MHRLYLKQETDLSQTGTSCFRAPHLLLLLHETAPSCAWKLLESRAPLRRQRNVSKRPSMFCGMRAEVNSFSWARTPKYELRHLCQEISTLQSQILSLPCAKWITSLSQYRAIFCTHTSLYFSCRRAETFPLLCSWLLSSRLLQNWCCWFLFVCRSNIYSAGEEGANLKQLALA